MIIARQNSPRVNHARVRGHRQSKYSIQKERHGGGFEMSRKIRTLKSNGTLSTSERSGNYKTNYRYFNGKKPLTPHKNLVLNKTLNVKRVESANLRHFS